MKDLRASLVFGFIAAAVNSIGAVQAAETTSNPHTGMRDFDFLVGEWRVHHHRLKPDGQEWVDFEGTCSNRKLMDGGANMEEHSLPAPYGAYRAVALRTYDPQTDQWAIWWLDGRYPSGPLDPPVKGRFEKGVGTFYNDYTQDGKPMRVRFIWSNITPTSARWEQSLSSDGGKTWATNWIMNFKRVTAHSAQGVAARNDVNDFDFLNGDWRVQHRYLRGTGDGRQWLNADGTASHRELMDGKANMEEYTINSPSGALSSRGAAFLRSENLAMVNLVAERARAAR